MLGQLYNSNSQERDNAEDFSLKLILCDFPLHSFQLKDSLNCIKASARAEIMGGLLQAKATCTF